MNSESYSLLESAFVELFDAIREEAKANVRARVLISFSVKGNFRRIVSPSFWRSKVESTVGSVVRKIFGKSRRDADSVMNVLYGTAESYTERLSEAVEAAARKAFSVDELVDAIDDVSPLGDLRLGVFLETTAHMIDEVVGFREAVSSGKRVKVWVTVGDDRVRDSHDETEGQRRLLSEEFVLGSGSRGMFPGDPRLPAADVVNCRCTLRFE